MSHQTASRAATVLLTVDVEPDCPPYLTSYRGIEEGVPRLLELFRRLDVAATFFVTGEVARRYPGAVRDIVGAGHEIGSHGDTHRCFADLTHQEARTELATSGAELRKFAPVTSFRAPYLRFPGELLSLLPETGYTLDSSLATYKPARGSRRTVRGLRRLPVSATSSVLRLPRWMRRACLFFLSSPVVLFVHPWEFVDLRSTGIRWDCRFNTGDQALACLEDVVASFRERGARFRRVCDLEGQQR